MSLDKQKKEDSRNINSSTLKELLDSDDSVRNDSYQAKPSKKLKDKVLSAFGFKNIQKEDISPILSTPSAMLSEILKIMVKAHEEKKLYDDKERNFFEQKQSKSEKRHKELIKALTGRVGVAEKIKQKRKSIFDKIAAAAIVVPVLRRIPTKPPTVPTPTPAPVPTPVPSVPPAVPPRPPVTPPAAPPAAPPAPPVTPPAAPPVTPTPPAVPSTPSPAEIARQQAARRAAEEAARRTADRAKEQAAKEGFRKSERDAERAATERAQREAAERAQREAAERAQREAAERARREAAERAAREEAARRTAEAQRRRDTRETDQEEAAREAAKSAERIAREQAARRAAEAERRRDVREAESEEAAREAAKSAERIARERQQQQPTARPETPSVPPATAQRIPQTAQSGRVGSVVIGSLAVTVAERVAAAESRGNYNISNMPPPEAIIDAANRTGFARPPSKQNTDHLIIKGNVDVTKSSANNIVYFTKNLTEMTIKEVCELAESRSRFYRRSGAGAAVGKYQFMGHGGVGRNSPHKSVLESYAKSVFGFGWENIIYDEQVQEILQQALLQDNARAIVNSNGPLTDISLYLSHFLGYGAAKKLIGIMGNGEIRGADSKQLMGEYMSEPARVANPKVASLTLEQYLNGLKKKGFNGKNFTLQELKTGVILPKPIPFPQKVSFLNYDTMIDEIDDQGFEFFAIQRNSYQTEGHVMVSTNENIEIKNKPLIYQDRPMIFQVGNFTNLYSNDSNLYEKKISPIIRS